jgi:hypothetical protein
MTHLFQAPTLGLGKLVSEGSRFIVPHHQRDYSWTEDEIAQLFLDIDEARSSNSDYYFLGLMVFIPSDLGDYTILDGQQRIATTVIILSAVRNWLRSYGFNRDADQIQSTFIARRELGEDNLHSRLFLNEVNNHHFDTFVINERPTADIQTALSKLKRYDANRTLLEAVLFCRSAITKMTDQLGDKEKGAKELFKFVKYLRDNVRVVRLTVPNEADAYTVFETLNDRGLDLTVLDLVKNYIFGKAGSKQRLGEIKHRWTQMMATLSNVRGDDFLKTYWTSRHGRTQKAQLFPSIKKYIKTTTNVSQFSEDMLRASGHYAAIELSDDPTWAGYSEESRDRIRVLKMLRSQSIHPVMLSAIAKFPHREMERLLSLLEVLIVRYQLVGGGRTGLLEIASAKLAAEIYQGKIKTAMEAYRALREIFPNDKEFYESFKIKQERTNTKAQYLLKRLEEKLRARQLDGMAASELTLKALTVEHIYPANSGPEWQELDTQDQSFAEDCTYRLGNLTLLTGINKDLGQKSFDKKKRVYEKSSLFITKSLSEYADWNRDAIDDRQAFMAKLATSIWRFQ